MEPSFSPVGSSGAAGAATPDREAPKCFVIMPYGDHFDRRYKEVYEDSIRSAGLEPRRADMLFAGATVVQSIWLHVQESSLVLVDLTELNANVYYELGLAHAASKPVILIAQDPKALPIDLQTLLTLTFDTLNPAWGKDLNERIQRAVKKVLGDPQPFILLRPLQAGLPTRDKLVTSSNPEKLSSVIGRYIDDKFTKDQVISYLAPHGFSPALIGGEFDKIFKSRAGGRSRNALPPSLAN